MLDSPCHGPSLDKSVRDHTATQPPSEMCEEFIVERLRACGLIDSPHPTLTPFGGGVSSDVWRVDDGAQTFVVKRCISKLRVEADWFADPARLEYERRYLERVGAIFPGAVPRLLATDAEAPFIAMEYLGAGFENWKTRMLAGNAEVEFARRAGSILGRVHDATRRDAAIARDFDSRPLFDQLRIDPYLRATAEKHPRLAATILAEASRLGNWGECLVHGDYSPKNMLVSSERLVVLDCETACHGDPAFDLAFLLNHLHLKALYHGTKGFAWRPLIEEARHAYFSEVGDDPALDTRASRLLLMLMLARVDGKSPVEYLQPSHQDRIRVFVNRRLNGWDRNLEALTNAWFSECIA